MFAAFTHEFVTADTVALVDILARVTLLGGVCAWTGFDDDTVGAFQLG